MVNPMVWIDDTVVYRAKKGQKTTSSSMNKLAAMPHMITTKLEWMVLGRATFS
jgi:hypothetical protein